MYDLVYIYEFEGNVSSRIPLVKADEDYLGFWKEASYSFLFFKKEKKALMQKHFPPCRSELVIRHEDWESGNSLDLLRVGRLILHPPWKHSPVNEGIPICIDPGMAFGSGYHASTKGCLTLLDKLFQKFIPERVLDLGTGTGILSVACLKMGSKFTYSLDYNNLSIETAKKNRSLNGVEKSLHLWMGDAKDFLYLNADLLLANMHFQVIDAITDEDSFYSKKYYLLSGLLGQEGYQIEEKVRRRLTLLDSHQENFWFTYLFRNLYVGSGGQRVYSLNQEKNGGFKHGQ
jgi:ribosomal protein L11 methyltransferase